MPHAQSATLFERAQRVLAGGPGTLSKHWSRFPHGIAPRFLIQGDGAWVWDEDGVCYVDCIGGLGPVLLGHCHPTVTSAIRKQAGMLVNSSLSTRLEVEVAEQLADLIPGAECVRFASNGHDVTNAAIKIARYFTGKQHVIFCGYHGQFDSYLSTTDQSGGILPQISLYNHQVPWRDMSALRNALMTSYKSNGHSDLAAIMLEVPPELHGCTVEETRQVLKDYQKTARQHDALFILDEVVTWGRYGSSGAQDYYGIQADLVCLSKALGNGYPISAILGPRRLMRCFDYGKVFLSTTFGASPLGLSACQAVLDALPHEYAALMAYGEQCRQQLYETFIAYDMPATIRGMHGRFVVDWHDRESLTATQFKTLWMQEMIRGGVLVSVVFLPMTCWDHTIVNTIINTAQHACAVIADVIHGKRAIEDALLCRVIKEGFERYKGTP